MHRDAEPAGGPGGKGQGSVVCLGDAFDDCQAEPDTCVVGMCAFDAALKRFDKRRYYLWGEFLAGVLDGEHHGLAVNARGDPHGAVLREVVDDAKECSPVGQAIRRNVALPPPAPFDA